MKRFYCYIVSFLIASICLAQNLPDNYTITTIENANLQEYRINLENDKFISPQHLGKEKKIRKSRDLMVKSLTVKDNNIYYDSYVVWYRNMLYCIDKKYVKDNTILDQNNVNLKKEVDSLQSALNYYSEQYRIQLTKSLNNLETQKSFLEMKLEQHSVANAQIKQDSITQEIRKQIQEKKRTRELSYKNWRAKQSASTRKGLDNLYIDINRLEYPNSAGGCDYTLIYRNKSSKTIKYLYWEGVAYNAVNDPVKCTITNDLYIMGKDTGPVKTNEEGGGIWECILYNYSARTLKLKSISIDYMDGSHLYLNEKDIKVLLDFENQAYNQQSIDYPNVPDIIEEYKEIRKKCEDQISRLDTRIRILQNFEGRFSNYYLKEEADRKIFQPINNAYIKSKELKLKLSARFRPE